MINNFYQHVQKKKAAAIDCGPVVYCLLRRRMSFSSGAISSEQARAKCV